MDPRIQSILTLTFAAVLCAQSDEGTRQLWDDNLQRRRPPAAAALLTKPRPAERVRLRTAVDPGDAFVGFTLWNLRPSKPGEDQGTRLLVQEEEGTREEFTPERVEANTPLPEGSRVRVSIEPARAGYLYVVDREQYADGSFSDPYLIFPTTRIRGGQNLVAPGTAIEIPDPEDKMPYFRLRRNRARRSDVSAQPAAEQSAEVLTVLISPKPLPGVQILRSAQKLSHEQFALWEKHWATQTKSLEASGQAGKPYTEAEKRAGQQNGVLTQADPLPQTIVHAEAKPGDPLLITVPIKIRK